MVRPILPPSSDIARIRRTIFYADTVSALVILGTGAVFRLSNQTAFSGFLSAGTGLVSQACAPVAAIICLLGIWRRPSTGKSLLDLSSPSEQRAASKSAQLDRAVQALYWKLIVLRIATRIVIVQAALYGVSAVVPY
ncbi:hypothetical protein [Nonomuraea aurantiaca]|jgi:hypothetical protein|uniref:hypothetical protein n=1 Tax=Nonomuraea aurantiaca TaxID=2878562 RepID=UPI001CDA3FA8|nr:hypothetical protein [Nonomuraea aurantiaca]MCA2224865.1 hypothetical protein [Nonomuraea aurantiaca]